MKILNTLYYYRPHYSGLTVYTERLARALASRGHTVTVLSSLYDRRLPDEEHMDGVHVRRMPVAFFLSKGPIMPGFIPAVQQSLATHDLVHLHVPQLEAAPSALLARRSGVPVVVTYHCDLNLPPSPLNSLANLVSRLANRIALAAADRVVVNTLDYAQASRSLSGRMEKLEGIPPPIEIPHVEAERVERLREKWGLTDRGPILGMAARLATEKGAEILARALPRILEQHPDVRVLYAGQHEEVLGEQAYGARIRSMLREMQANWSFLGVLDDSDLAAFFSLCDLTVLPSLNSTESFGMVQVESMLCGTPVIASDLPGVREPAMATGMGLTFPPGDHLALAGRILDLLASPETYHRDPETIRARYGTEAVADRYEHLFGVLAGVDSGK